MTTSASHSDIKLSYVYVIHHHSEVPVSLQVVRIGFDVGGFEVQVVQWGIWVIHSSRGLVFVDVPATSWGLGIRWQKFRSWLSGGKGD